MRETGILDKMAQREREGVRYVNVDARKRRALPPITAVQAKTTGKQKRRAFCASWRCGGRTGSKYYNPGQADGYTETNLQRYLDLTIAPPAAALGCVERIL